MRLRVEPEVEWKDAACYAVMRELASYANRMPRDHITLEKDVGGSTGYVSASDLFVRIGVQDWRSGDKLQLVIYRVDGVAKVEAARGDCRRLYAAAKRLVEEAARIAGKPPIDALLAVVGGVATPPPDAYISVTIDDRVDRVEATVRMSDTRVARGESQRGYTTSAKVEGDTRALGYLAWSVRLASELRAAAAELLSVIRGWGVRATLVSGPLYLDIAPSLLKLRHGTASIRYGGRVLTLSGTAKDAAALASMVRDVRRGSLEMVARLAEELAVTEIPREFNGWSVDEIVATRGDITLRVKNGKVRHVVMVGLTADTVEGLLEEASSRLRAAMQRS